MKHIFPGMCNNIGKTRKTTVLKYQTIVIFEINVEQIYDLKNANVLDKFFSNELKLPR